MFYCQNIQRYSTLSKNTSCIVQRSVTLEGTYSQERSSMWFVLFADPPQDLREAVVNLVVKKVRTHSPTAHLPKCTLFAPPPSQFCIIIVFNFSWDGCNTQEKWKTKVMQNFGEQTRCIMWDVQVVNSLLVLQRRTSQFEILCWNILNYFVPWSVDKYPDIIFLPNMVMVNCRWSLPYLFVATHV